MRVLMCPPNFYDINTTNPINPRMVEKPNLLKAKEQWNKLVGKLKELDVKIELLEPVKGLNDMVFTAGMGLVFDNYFIVSNFRFTQRWREERYVASWFAKKGYELKWLPLELNFEGAGDVKFYRDVIFAGYGFRTDYEAHRLLEKITKRKVVSLELVDDYFFHLDICLAPLDDETVVYYPPAFSSKSLQDLKNHVKDPVEVNEKPLALEICNCVVVERNVVLSRISQTIRRELEDRGFEINCVNLSEFVKSGGSAACLTLRID